VRSHGSTVPAHTHGSTVPARTHGSTVPAHTSPPNQLIALLRLLGTRCLAPESIDDSYRLFCLEHGITILTELVGENREPFIGMSEMAVEKCVRILSDPALQPVLVHCTSGKAQTGCVVACLRRRQGWSLTATFDEFLRFGNAARSHLLDLQFIEHHMSTESGEEGRRGPAVPAGFAEAPYPPRSVAGREVEPLSTVSHFFVYGSLRPDDDSGKSWTRDFVEGFEDVRRASLSGAQMFYDQYASVTLDGTSDQVVHGYVLGYLPQPGVDELSAEHSSAFDEKLRAADEIEGFREDDVEKSLYQRAVKYVSPGDGARPVKAFVYHRPDCDRSCPILSGDWLKRKEHRAAATELFESI